MRSTVIWMTAGLIGCAKAPVEAPAELGAIGLFLFEHFEDEDTEELAAGLNNLLPFLEAEDFDLDPKDRAVTMPVLEGAALGGLSIPAGVEASSQVPVALARQSPHNMALNRELAMEPNRVCIESSTTVWAERSFVSGEDCFGDGSCDRLEVTQEVRKENALAKVWYDQFITYRVFDIEDEEGNISEVMMQRMWIEEVGEGDGGNSSWDQLFGLDIVIERDSGTIGWLPYWSSISVVGIGDDIYANLVIDGLADSALYADEFMANTQISCPLDRNAEKPPRD